MALPSGVTAQWNHTGKRCVLHLDAKCAGHTYIGLARTSSSRLSKGQGGGGAARSQACPRAQRGANWPSIRPADGSKRTVRPKCRTVSTPAITDDVPALTDSSGWRCSDGACACR